MKEINNSIALDFGSREIRLIKQGKLVSKFRSSSPNGKENLIFNGKIGAINDIERVLRKELKKLFKPFLGFLYLPFSSLVSVHSCLGDDVQLRAFRDILEHSGAKNVYMLYDCYFAAKGLGIDINRSKFTIIDCGAGKTSITTLDKFEIVKNEILDIAGNTFDENIQIYLSRMHNLKVDGKTAEKVKIELVDLRSNYINSNLKISGKVKGSDELRNLTISTEEINECIINDVDILVESIVRHIENLDDNVRKEIDTGKIYLIGKAFKLKGLLEKVSSKVNIAAKSYNLNEEYLIKGIEQIQRSPGEFLNYMVR